MGMKTAKRLTAILLCLTFFIENITVTANEPVNTSLLILGDSISTGYGLENPKKDCYGAKLAEDFKLTGTDYINLAADGATSNDL
ncbi:MAG: hypothetical protein FWD23_17565, partial [Oscillospiraceae bacterium]|nr:hypothetical protein [Oscillospiraceae bacterium]